MNGRQRPNFQTSRKLGTESRAKLEHTIKSLKGQLKNTGVSGTRARGSARSGTTINASDSNLTVKGYEFWGIPGVGGVSEFNFKPGVSNIPRLDKYAALWDLWRLKSCTVHYVPSVGSTVNGMVHLGIDYDASSLPSSVGEVVALNPIDSGPVWEEHCVKPSAARVNKLSWMYTAGPLATPDSVQSGFAACTFITSNSTNPTVLNYGEVWVQYEVEFTSPSTVETQLVSQSLRNVNGYSFLGGAGNNLTRETDDTQIVEDTGNPKPVKFSSLADQPPRLTVDVSSGTSSDTGAACIDLTCDGQGLYPGFLYNYTIVLTDSTGHGFYLTSDDKATLEDETKGYRVGDIEYRSNNTGQVSTFSVQFYVQVPIPGFFGRFAVKLARNGIADASKIAVSAIASTVGAAALRWRLRDANIIQGPNVVGSSSGPEGRRHWGVHGIDRDLAKQ